MSEMSDKQAIAEVRKFSQFVKAFQHLGEVADTFSRSGQLLAERDEQLVSLEEKIAEGVRKFNTLGEQTQALAAELKERAAANDLACDKLFAKARIDAAGITSDAKAELEQLVEQKKQAGSELRKLRKQITATQAQHDALLPKLEKARAQARKILGADA